MRDPFIYPSHVLIYFSLVLAKSVYVQSLTGKSCLPGRQVVQHSRVYVVLIIYENNLTNTVVYSCFMNKFGMLQMCESC